MLRLAASGWLPAHWFAPPPPPPSRCAAKTGHLELEIVSHCWRYGHFLAYQLSSLVNFPPQGLTVTMTVFYAPEDPATCELLEHFGGKQVPGVRWNWRPLPKEQLFRRAIGRNRAALETQADWIWFTDCDVLFRDDCFPQLADALQGRRDPLVFPQTERCTPLLPETDPLLQRGAAAPQVVDIANAHFTQRQLKRATGPMQITHGDVARACGYCPTLKRYQLPADHFCKAYEDRAFRWLLDTQGTPLDVPGIYRIRHIEKGRYRRESKLDQLRGRIRQWSDGGKYPGARPSRND